MFKFAIIGCGEVARIHATNIQHHGKLHAVCDIVPEKADELAKEYKVKAWYNVDELLENEKEIDVVVICTPNGYHAEHCIKSLQAGKHVLCESPLCLTKAAAWQMIETEKFCRRKLFVVNPVADNKELFELKERIDQHTNEHFYSYELKCTMDVELDHEKEWKFMKFPGGGSLYTHFNNYIDALVYLFGEIEEVKGFSDNISHKDFLEFEDTGEAALKMTSEIPGNIIWSLNDNDHEEAALQILTLMDPLSVGNLEKILLTDRGRYQKIYQWFIHGLDANPSNLYDATKSIEAIEKIYKAVSLNANGH
ncbi:MAG: Gfo/Idh/MocA family protein [Flavisolibacter sp.]